MDFLVALVGVLLRILDALLGPVLWWRTRRHRQVPPIEDDRLRFSVTEIAERIRNGKLSSESIVSAYITRIEEVNPLINAVVEDRFSAALAEARQVDSLLAEARQNGRIEHVFEGKPLLGVPFTVKESCQLAGLSNAVGCLEHANRKSAADGGAVSLVRRAGGIPLLVSNTPELCLGWETKNLLRGTTCNPYCLARSAGGSSGGEAALISCGASPWGVGSDLAGSVRLPAAYCGLFGMKPTPGVISIEGHIPTLQDEMYKEFLTVGPIARHASDLPLLLEVMAGDRARLLRLNEPVDLKKVKVYYMTEATKSIGLMDVDKQIKELVVSAARHLQQCGCELSEEKFTEFEHAMEMSVAEFFSMKDIPNMLLDPNNPKVERSMLSAALRLWCGCGARSAQSLLFTLIDRTRLFMTSRAHARHRANLANLRTRLQEALSNGVLLMPTACGAAPALGRYTLSPSCALYTMPANVLRLPALTAPVALAHTPAAVQIISAPYQDRLCVAVAQELEKRFGGWSPPQ